MCLQSIALRMTCLSVALLGLSLCPPAALASEPGAYNEIDRSVGDDGCTTVHFTVHSKAMDRDIQAVAILPPAAAEDAAATFPVLYALHGRGAPYEVYSNMSRLKRAMKDMPVIVVSFNADVASWYVDSTVKSDSQFTTFFFEEYLPTVESSLPANGLRGVTGFSMGGYGSMHYMLTRPEMFVNVSGMSSAVDWIIKADGSVEGNFKDLFGDVSPDDPTIQKLRILPRLRAAVAAGVKLPPIYEHCGTEDFLIENNRHLRDVLVELNAEIAGKLEAQVANETDKRQKARKLAALVEKNRINFMYVESPGAHNWGFWHGNIVDLLTFHYRGFVAAEKARQAGR